MGGSAGNIQALERATGIRVLPNTQLHQLGMPKACHCGTTLKRLMRRYGQSHIEQVIELMVTTGSASELYSASITAVADLLHEQTVLLNLGGDLFELFDKIDMAEAKRVARKANRHRLSQSIKVVLFLKLNEATEGKLLKWV